MPEIKTPVILHLTSTILSGAGKYTMDFHQSMLARGYQSHVAARGQEMIYPDGSKHKIKETKSYWWNKLKRYIFRIIVKHIYVDKAYAMHNLCERFTCHSAAETLAAMPVKPDVVFVHWVSDYANAEFISQLKHLTNAEIVFILVDHALYSGGCHYQIECQNYKDGCHDCPATTSRLVKRAIERNYAFKKKWLPDSTIFIHSEADRRRLTQSELYKGFRLKEVSMPMDDKKFKPASNKLALRSQWRIPLDKKMVFFGATSLDERRKGIKELLIALPKVQTKDVIYVAAGNVNDLSLPKNTLVMGYLNETQLIQVYQMADVFVCPTLADAGPMMVNQSLMCGTPVVAFPVGASLSLVQTGQTGYMAKYGNSEDLANGIDYVLSKSEKERNQMSQNCRRLAIETYANPQKHEALYEFIEQLAHESRKQKMG